MSYAVHTNKRRRMSTTLNAREHQDLLANKVLPLLVANEWLGVAELARLNQLSSSREWVMEESWELVARRTWPETNVYEFVGEGEQCLSPTFRGLFGNNFPRNWLTLEVQRVIAKEEWQTPRHLNRYCMIECGRCGCNCGDGGCGGIPIHTEFRYDRIQKLEWFEAFESGRAKTYCQSCFEQCLQEGDVKQEEYKKVAPCLLKDILMDHLWSGEGRLLLLGQEADETFLRFLYLYDRYIWKKKLEGNGQEAKLDDYPGPEITLDDFLVVLAYCLAHEKCTKYKTLNLSSCADAFSKHYGELGIKALAFAFSMNTSVESLLMFQDRGIRKACCMMTNANADKSGGLLLKAIQHNARSRLKRLRLCPQAFGFSTLKKLRKHVDVVEEWTPIEWIGSGIVWYSDGEERPECLATIYSSFDFEWDGTESDSDVEDVHDGNEEGSSE